ncbi:hypothetical protein BD310DRAFT_199883 [Dichomitus squalens]|uniref:Uncharacterized protein n=1 Tax=Dichomitus squalens TaxID=114155 RepID=A0A4Q9PHB5_9APHY|nr:hypothetical protein BD310DRAFT_199883 [Dichomitus squalens]
MADARYRLLFYKTRRHGTQACSACAAAPSPARLQNRLRPHRSLLPLFSTAASLSLARFPLLDAYTICNIGRPLAHHLDSPCSLLSSHLHPVTITLVQRVRSSMAQSCLSGRVSERTVSAIPSMAPAAARGLSSHISKYRARGGLHPGRIYAHPSSGSLPGVSAFRSCGDEANLCPSYLRAASTASVPTF